MKRSRRRVVTVPPDSARDLKHAQIRLPPEPLRFSYSDALQILSGCDSARAPKRLLKHGDRHTDLVSDVLGATETGKLLFDDFDS